VVITDPSNRAYPDILFYLGQAIQDTGNRMLVFALPREAEASVIVRDILAYHVDGIVSSAALDDDVLALCSQANVPVVLFNRTPKNAMASAICCDHAAGMETLVRHLGATPMGHVAILSGPESAPVSRERLEGALRALERIGQEATPVLHGDYTFEGGRRAAPELLAGRDGPHAVVCVNDAMALGVMDACRFELGLTVPGDVAVTGFDDIPQASWPSYGLTTLRQPVRRMAQTAVRMLMEQVDGTSAGGERRLLSPEIRIRASTRSDGIAHA
jgi:DNA-binding LacI/PurR family transcriptional regulator